MNLVVANGFNIAAWVILSFITSSWWLLLSVPMILLSFLLFTMGLAQLNQGRK